MAGAAVPQDRAIDGVDQTDFLLGKSEKSNREGFPVFVAERLEAVKWRNWKLTFYEEQRDWWSPPIKLGVPKLFDLIADPKEEYPQNSIRNTWVAEPALKVVVEFEANLKKYPPIEPGTPDPYTPPYPGRALWIQGTARAKNENGAAGAALPPRCALREAHQEAPI
jgi:arylsulfatase